MATQTEVIANFEDGKVQIMMDYDDSTFAAQRVRVVSTRAASPISLAISRPTGERTDWGRAESNRTTEFDLTSRAYTLSRFQGSGRLIGFNIQIQCPEVEV